MEVVRYKFIFILLALIFNCDCNENTKSTKGQSTSDKNANCPFTKIIEDVFKIHNKSAATGIYLKDTERVKLLLSTISNVTNLNDTNSTLKDEIVDTIIASINKIKNNFTSEKSDDDKLNEAIIINRPQEKSTEKSPFIEFSKVTLAHIKSGFEEKIDKKQPPSTTPRNIIEKVNFTRREDTFYNITKKEEVTYVEILTIEPNNTNPNNTSKNIIDILNHLTPIFNSSLAKDMQNITIIERHGNKNQTITASKNISTIVVTYCDKENYTKIDMPIDPDTIIRLPGNETIDYDDPDSDDNADDLTNDEKSDILEAAEYGMQKMHELYSVMEPKLYSMGFWLDETNPARYVAAFNAPSEDATKFSRYGYASIQAAARLKQIVSSGSDDGAESRTEQMQFPKASALRESPLLQQCPLRGTPKCPPASKRYRTHDGTCNNLNRPRWGSTMTPVQRFLPPSYSDDLQAPRRSVTGTKLPSAREISSLVHEDRYIENRGITHLLMQWGQFLDHDITSTSQSRGFNGSVPRCCKDGGRDFVPKEFMHPECFPIAVPPSDPFYGPLGVRCLDFVRSSPAPRDDCSLGWREQLNQVSVFIDGSPLYGSSARKSDKLRLFRNGMLQYGRVQQRRPLLPPERRDELCRGGALSADCFKSGDARVNEHPGLVAAHIVWLRLHNRLAQELAHLNPPWSDEKIYQETRKIVGAMIQHITYKEFLPIVLGEDVMRLFELELLNKGYFKHYDPKVNPSTAGSFGSAAFRFGHSLVQSSFMRYDRFHRPMKNNVTLHDEITNPSNIWSMGAVDRLLFGMFNQPIQDRDEFMTRELTNHLFQTPQVNFGMDLAAINIQRGRDHGIPAYTSWREPCGLSPILEFEDLFRVMPARVARKMQILYRHVDDIDLFTGGLSERPVVGGLVGPTFACIIAQQFSNLRKGDRFWYENGGFDSSFTPAQLQQIRRISFAQVLCRTLDTIDSVQPFVFLTSDFPDNERISCTNRLLDNFDLSPWIEVNSDFENDIAKSIDKETKTESPKTIKQDKNTTTKPTDTMKDQWTVDVSNLIENRPPDTVNATKEFKPNLTYTMNADLDSTTKNTTTDKMTISKLTTQIIDDKLDFKNKSRRYENIDRLDTRRHQYRPTEEYDDYDDDNIQSVQSVVINNLNNKRPYHRPVISVTERLDKFTYLINYVPKSTTGRPTTKFWRQTTRPWRQTTKNTQDRDIVKLTYQTYDDTYRRPTNYYYDRQDNDKEERHDSPKTTDSSFQLARSNDKVLPTSKPNAINTTLNEWQKLVTFGYIGTYKADNLSMTRPDKIDYTNKEVKDILSKDFSTEPPLKRPEDADEQNLTKLSTFFLYDTVTKPFNFDRPTRRYDEEKLINIKPNKYYYVRNVLHKYPDSGFIVTDKLDDKKINDKPNVDIDNLEHSVDPAEDRSGGVMTDLDESEPKSAEPTTKLKQQTKRPGGPAKTPSIAFQVIPSENSPSNWAVYEENQDIVETLHKMPIIVNSQAQKELPRPLQLTGSKRGRS